MDLVPDDSLLTETIDYFWPLDMIRMAGAWDITTGDPDVSVGIVDGAFDTSHPELLGDAEAGLPSRVCHYETVYPTSSLPPEETEHGTHVVGKFEAQIDFDPGPGVDEATAGDGGDIFIWMLDRSGDHLWAGTLGSDGWSDVTGVVVDVRSTVIVTGWFTGTMGFDPEGGGEAYSTDGETNSFVLALQ